MATSLTAPLTTASPPTHAKPTSKRRAKKRAGGWRGTLPLLVGRGAAASLRLLLPLSALHVATQVTPRGDAQRLRRDPRAVPAVAQ